MKIALVSTTMGVGGAEKQISDLAAVLCRAGHDVSIISLKGDSSQHIESGVDLVELKARKSILGLVRLVFQLVKVLRAIQPDVVHGHMVTANLLTRLIKPLVGWPVTISTAHSTNEGGGKFRVWSYRLTDSLADLTTNVSEGAVRHYISIGVAKASRIRAMYNGIDFNRYIFSKKARDRLRNDMGIGDSTTIYIAVGRLVPAKDYMNLLHAYALLVQRIPDSRLMIVGDGPEKLAIMGAAEKLGLSSNLMMLGLRLDISDLMSAADVFVLSSAWEGFGLVITEAIACLLPVVATDCGGVAENLDGFGHLVPTQNSDALAQAMIDVISKGDRKSDFRAVAARQHAEKRFAIDCIAHQWMRVYSDLVRTC